MKQKAIIDFLPSPYQDVIRQFILMHQPLVIISRDMTCKPFLSEALEKTGSRIVALHSLLTPEKTATAQQDANRLLNQFIDYFGSADSRQTKVDSQKLINIIYKRLHEQLPVITSLLQSLEIAKEKYDIRLMVLNENHLTEGVIASLWARANGIKSLHMSHGMIICGPHNLELNLLSDYTAVFGERGIEGYRDGGKDTSKIVVTGNPRWDNYAHLHLQKNTCREQLCLKYGLRADIPLIVFGTTWAHGANANSDLYVYRNTLKDFLLACHALKKKGVLFNAVIKDRVRQGNRFYTGSSARCFEEIVHSLGHDAGSYLYILEGETQLFAVAADVLITVDSNYLVEGVLTGTSVINLQSDQSIVFGPSYHADSGVIEVEAHELPEAIFQLAFNAQARARQQEKRQNVIEQHSYKNDGNATRRVAQLMHELAPDIGPWEPLPPLWQRCLNAEPVDLQLNYPAIPDYNLLNMFSNQPRFFLDIGCGTGSNARVIKEKFPDCRVWGIECDKAAADIASSCMDKVITGMFESINFDQEGLVKGTLDAILLAGTLEYMHNPWDVMMRLRSYLSAQGQVLLSVHNLRNLSLMDDISKGAFPYKEEGLLNIRHIRFFTLRELLKLCQETGYRVVSSQLSPDECVWGYVEYFKGKFPANIDLGKLILKEVTEDELVEMCALQFYFLLEKSA